MSRLGRKSCIEAVVNPGESYIALGDGTGAWGAWEDWASLLEADEPDGWLWRFMYHSLPESGVPEGVSIAVDNHPLKGYARVMVILDGLKLTAGGSEVALSPAFDIREKSYRAAVGSGVSSVTVSAGALSGMTVTVLNPDGATAASGDGKASAVIPLRVGSNRITVTVCSAENPEYARTYEIRVTRASSGGGSGGGSSSGGSSGTGAAPAPVPEAGKTDYAACARDAACPVRAFDDLDPEAWYHDGVHYALSAGIMNGTGSGRFDPDVSATRAEIATIIMRYCDMAAEI